jgi:alpha-glucosidase
LQSGVLTPFCWTHSGGPGNLEPWAFGNRLEEINRSSIKLRYHLLPYIYTAFWEAAETGVPIMRPLLLDFPEDRAAVDRNDEYLFGNDLLVAPVTKDYDISRGVYLPRGVWYDYWTDRRYAGPVETEAAAPTQHIPLFVRGGAIIPSQQDMQYTDQSPIDPLTLDVYPEGTSSRPYYEDDGISFEYQHGVFLRQTFTTRCLEKSVAVEISAREGSYVPPRRALVIRIHGQKLQPRQVTFAGRELAARDSVKALLEVPEGWTYDEAGVVWTRVPDQGRALKLEVTQ